jgi:hypothetical protein
VAEAAVLRAAQGVCGRGWVLGVVEHVHRGGRRLRGNCELNTQ